MEYLVTQAEMKQYDQYTTSHFKIPSVVLMERAALVTAEALAGMKGRKPCRVLVVSGCGNNGGDGFAVGRLMMLQGCQVDCVLLGNREKCSPETALQLDILAQYGHTPYDTIPAGEYDIVIDAVFGIGLTRDVEGIYKEAVRHINQMDAYVCSIDIPSGIHADSGRIMGCAVKADLTVTYGFPKLGERLYPGTEYCGKIICGQMGIDEHVFACLGKRPCWYAYDRISDVRLPVRRPDANKGTFGKALVIAGSDGICGAALLAARSVFRAGAGMVRVVTSVQNRNVIQQAVPEAMFTLYDTGRWQEEEPEKAFAEAFHKALEWADCILIGPGIGTGKEAVWLLDQCLYQSVLPVVIDADGLNLLAQKRPYAQAGTGERKMILTPHLAEFARLYGCSVKEAAENITVYPRVLAGKLRCTVVCKDARTVVARHDREQNYLNLSGNEGMATAGSGDVLAGMITGLLAQGLKAGLEAGEAAVSGVYLHGLAGDMAAARLGKRSLTASDLIEQMAELLCMADAPQKAEDRLSKTCDGHDWPG